jgi:3-oxoadipate enol-lactonase
MTQIPRAAQAPALTSTLLAGDSAALAAGDKPLLLVGPSLGTSVEAVWGPAVPHLKEHCVVVGWDLPGHGRSAVSSGPFTIDDLADGVEAVLTRLTREHQIPASTPVLAAGVSIAGAVALTLALRHETRIDRLAVVCSAAKIGTPEAWAERAELVERAGTPTMVEGSAQRWFAPGFMARQGAVATALLSSLQYTDRHSYAQACRALGGYDLTNELDALSRPVLLIHGAHDQVCPPAEAEVILRAAGEQAQLSAVTLEEVAHLAPAEAPEKTARLLLEFLDV